MAAAKSTRGLDGLTAEELRASRRGWWDDSLTEFLLRRIPASTRAILEVGCGLATAAHALLPSLPRTSYLGVDADGGRLGRAAELLARTDYADRIELVRGRAERLPCQDSIADMALSSMTLQHIEDLPTALSEIRRVLRPSGRLVAMEPDNLANLFYFDGVLPEVNAAFRALFAAQREAHRPADVALGPSVPGKLEAAGFTVLECRPYLLGRMSRLTAGEFFEGARRVAATVSAAPRSPSDGSTLRGCVAALNAALAKIGPETVGHGGHLVPVFVSVAVRERLAHEGRLRPVRR